MVHDARVWENEGRNKAYEKDNGSIEMARACRVCEKND